MGRRSKGKGWRRLVVVALALGACATATISQAADLTVDGGATYTVNSDANFNNAYVGNLSTGTVNQSGFTTTLAGNLYLGYFFGSTGDYNLGAGTLAADSEYIGYSGNGVFTHTGGTNALTGNLTLGYLSGSSGVYNLSGGSNIVPGILILGYNSGSSGAYNQNGGSLSAGFAFIGYQGLGAFTKNGGTHVINDNLYLGESPGSNGSYNLNNGSLAASREYVGYRGSGIFTQTGGDNTVVKKDIFSGLYLGYFGSGTYNLINGILTAPSEDIGVFGTGVFNQYSGANKINGNLSIGSGRNGSGVYNLSGGTLAVEDEVIGSIGSGVFTQTGGVHTITYDLVLAANFSSTASLALLGGSLSVGGNYTQNPGGNLALGIASLSNYERITIGGAASLNGTLTPVLLGYRPQANQIYSGLLTAAGGITGTFTLTNPWIGPTLYWQPRYTPNRVDLLVQRDYNHPGLGLSGNQAPVGAVLKGLAGSATGDLAGVLDVIDGLSSPGAVAGAFQQISPDKAASLANLGFAGAELFRQSLANRITNLRYGTLAGTGGAAGSGGLSLSGSRLDGLLIAYNSTDLARLIAAKREATPPSRWGVYLDPGLALGSQKSSPNQTGFSFTIAGFTAGADYRVRDDLLVGLASGYGHAGAGLHGSGGGVENHTWPLTAYAAYLPESFYAFGSAGYALNLFNLKRNLVFDGLSRTAKSATTANQFNAYGETGYDLKGRSLVLTPLVSLAYSGLWINGFTEGGAGSLNLKVDAQQADSLQTGIGGKLTALLKRNPTLVVPQVYATYQHEFANNSRGLDARLSQGGGAFAFQTEQLGRNFGVVGANVTIIPRKDFAVQLNYNAEVGRDRYTVQMINAGLRYEF